MGWNITFGRPTEQNLGRYSYFKSFGLQVVPAKNGEIWLSPIKRNGEVARCSIAIPIESLEDLIGKLQEARQVIAEDSRAGFEENIKAR